MSSAVALQHEESTGLCAACGIPLDSQYFDDSSIQKVPGLGQEVVLARFDLPAQYCGVLQYFAQFTDAYANNQSHIATPELEWSLRVNNHALYPYINLRRIVNPWGEGSFPVNIRLDDTSTVELVARGVADDKTLTGTAAVGPVTMVGGRIVGRFWYNASYGDVV